jgi:uncharacterized alpha/beta hydrolase family protein|tara:strand:+ start:269 stop:601 length:333 start_codon:yes stop_codon:yes gene_type:complete
MKKLVVTLIVLLFSTNVFSQIVVTHFNAAWNEPNKAEWVGELSDCDITYVDIVKSPKIQQKHKVVVVPTIIVFDENGDEVKRWQADLSFKMVATKKEIQDYVDELIMSSF